MTVAASPDLLVGPHERAEHLGVPYCARCGLDQVWPCPWSCTLKALTLHQPYASLICAGAKGYETRSWKTSYRGWLAVHAGASIPSYLGLGRRGTIQLGDYEVATDRSGLLLRGGGLEWPYRMPLGAIVAVAELLDCVPMVDGQDHGGIDRPCVSILGSTLTYFDADVGSDRDVVTLDDQGPYGDFTPGRWAWKLGRVLRLTRPVPCVGHQGLWDLRRAGPEAVYTVEGTIERRAA